MDVTSSSDASSDSSDSDGSGSSTTEDSSGNNSDSDDSWLDPDEHNALPGESDESGYARMMAAVSSLGGQASTKSEEYGSRKRRRSSVVVRAPLEEDAFNVAALSNTHRVSLSDAASFQPRCVGIPIPSRNSMSPCCVLMPNASAVPVLSP